MLTSRDSFYLTKAEPEKSCLLALRDIILESNKAISETVKYGMPCFTLASKPFCYLWTDKHSGEPYILFVAGSQLSFSELEAGNRTKMKILRVNPVADLPVGSIKKILTSAIALHKT